MTSPDGHALLRRVHYLLVDAAQALEQHAPPLLLQECTTHAKHNQRPELPASCSLELGNTTSGLRAGSCMKLRREAHRSCNWQRSCARTCGKRVRLADVSHSASTKSRLARKLSRPAAWRGELQQHVAAAAAAAELALSCKARVLLHATLAQSGQHQCTCSAACSTSSRGQAGARTLQGEACGRALTVAASPAACWCSAAPPHGSPARQRPEGRQQPHQCRSRSARTQTEAQAKANTNSTTVQMALYRDGVCTLVQLLRRVQHLVVKLSSRSSHVTPQSLSAAAAASAVCVPAAHLPALPHGWQRSARSRLAQGPTPHTARTPAQQGTPQSRHSVLQQSLAQPSWRCCCCCCQHYPAACRC